MKTRIAHVGAFKRFSSNDVRRITVALHWLVTHKIELGKPVHDIINLHYGRDFLRETLEYDIVIIHSVFSHYFPAKSNDAGTSEMHDMPHWIDRLLSTKAKVIFLFSDQPNSLSDGHIGKLTGYQKVESPEEDLAIYERKIQ